MTERYIPANSTPVTSDAAPGAIVYYYTDKRGLAAAIAYHGRATKPDWHRAYYHAVSRDKDAADFFKIKAGHAEYARQRKQPHTCKVGDIFNFCWGYDQTNQDFYQVVAVSAGTVTVREIATRVKVTPGALDMASWVVPVPDQFTGAPMVKRPYMWQGRPCLRIKSYGSCQLWDGNPKYETSYA